MIQCPLEAKNDGNLHLTTLLDAPIIHQLTPDELATLAKSRKQAARSEYADAEQVRHLSGGPLGLVYTREASEELGAVLDAIALEWPGAARRVQARLFFALDLLTRPGPVGVATDAPPLRRVIVRPYPFVVFYERSSSVVAIAIRRVSLPLLAPARRIVQMR